MRLLNRAKSTDWDMDIDSFFFFCLLDFIRDFLSLNFHFDFNFWILLTAKASGERASVS